MGAAAPGQRRGVLTRRRGADASWMPAADRRLVGARGVGERDATGRAGRSGGARRSLRGHEVLCRGARVLVRPSRSDVGGGRAHRCVPDSRGQPRQRRRVDGRHVHRSARSDLHARARDRCRVPLSRSCMRSRPGPMLSSTPARPNSSSGGVPSTAFRPHAAANHLEDGVAQVNDGLPAPTYGSLASRGRAQRRGRVRSPGSASPSRHSPG